MVSIHSLHKILLLLPFAYPPTQPPAQNANVDWSYDAPENWGTHSPTCNGNRQSPIHLTTASSFILPLLPINFVNYDVPLAGPLTLVNNGHSIDISLPPTVNGNRPYISGGIMKSIYEAVGLHFHWGSPTNKGSEHAIDNRRYDVEMHIVHKNVIYNTMEEAVQHKDGIAVLGVMFKIVQASDRIYPGLNKVFNQLPNLVEYESTATINGRITLGQFLGDLNTKHFFSYSGSLTTPHCNEAVIWTVFPEPLPISRKQIEKFFPILDLNDNSLQNNYRPLQARNKRPVFYRVGGFKGVSSLFG